MSGPKQLVHLTIYFLFVAVALALFGAPTWAILATLFVIGAMTARIRLF